MMRREINGSHDAVKRSRKDATRHNGLAADRDAWSILKAGAEKVYAMFGRTHGPRSGERGVPGTGIVSGQDASQRKR